MRRHRLGCRALWRPRRVCRATRTVGREQPWCSPRVCRSRGPVARALQGGTSEPRALRPAACASSGNPELLWPQDAAGFTQVLRKQGIFMLIPIPQPLKIKQFTEVWLKESPLCFPWQAPPAHCPDTRMGDNLK